MTLSPDSRMYERNHRKVETNDEVSATVGGCTEGSVLTVFHLSGLMSIQSTLRLIHEVSFESPGRLS